MGNPAVLFNTHLYVKKLKIAGVPETQAEVHAETLATLFEDRLATKDDLSKLEQHTNYKTDDLDQRLNYKDDVAQRLSHKIDEIEQRLELNMAQLKTDMIKWLIGISLIQTALILSLAKLFRPFF